MERRTWTAALLWDRFGMSISGICAIHCLIIPVLISLLPLWPVGAAFHDWAHPVFIILIIPVAFFAARRSHFDRKISTLLSGGLFLVLLGWILGHFWLGIWAESGLTLVGSALLIAGHWFNYRHHQRCTNSHHNHHPVAEEVLGEPAGKSIREQEVKR